MRISPVACIARLQKWLLKGGWRSQEDVEDLIQEAYLRVEEYSRRKEVRNKEALLRCTVTNLMINQHRRKARATHVEVPIQQLTGSLDPPDPYPDLERQLDAQQRLDRIQRVLEAGSRRTCQIYVAHRGGYTHSEIAAAFGIKETTVEKHIARAVFLLMRAKETP